MNFARSKATMRGVYLLAMSVPMSWCFLATSLFWPTLSLALPAAVALNQLDITVFDRAAFLTQFEIAKVVSTNDGYLWVLTKGGDLARFDGNEFMQIGTSENLPLEEGRFNEIAIDDSGHLLAASSGSGVVFRLTGVGVNSSWERVSNLALNTIFVIPGVKRAGILTSQIFDLDSEKALASFQPFLTQSTRVTDVSIDTVNGLAWISELSGHIFRFDGNTLDELNLEVLGGKELKFYAIEVSGESLFVGDFHHGLLWFKNGKLRKIFTEYQGDIVRDIQVDRGGEVWIASLRKGLSRISNDVVQQFDPNHVLSKWDLRTLFFDRAQNLWIGTHNNGLVRLSTPFVKKHFQSNGAPIGAVWSITQALDQSLWIATNRSGFMRSVDGVFQPVIVPELLKQNVIASQVFASSRDNRVYLSTVNQGLYQWFNGKVSRVDLNDAEGNNKTVAGVYEQANGALWVDTMEDLGIMVRKRDQWQLLEGEIGGLASCMSASPNDGVLIGTYGQGVHWLNKEGVRTKSIAKRDGLAHDIIAATHLDRLNQIWVGTWGHGLSWINAHGIQILRKSNGLPSDTIFGITTDLNDDLWILSDQGLSVIDRRSLTQFGFNASTRVLATSFGVENGMQLLDGAGGHPPTLWRSQDGQIWVATMEGVISIDPMRIPKLESPAPAIIDRVQVNGRSIDLKNLAPLPWDFERIAIDFSAPEINALNRLLFRYRLIGFDSTYQIARRDRVASFTRLTPKEYTFEVDVSGSDGVWLNKPARFQFTVAEPWYQTKWFWFGLLAIVALLTWFSFKYRLAILRERVSVLKERNRIATELHDSLAQGMIAVRTRLEVVDELIGATSSEAKTFIASALSILSTTVNDAYESMWELRHDRGAKLIDLEFIKRIVKEVFGDQTINLDLSHQRNVPAIVPGEQYQNLKKMIREALLNIRRHAEASSVELKIAGNGQNLEISIQDNGRGFDLDKIPEQDQIGLNGIRTRAEQIKAKVELRSTVGVGTLWLIRLPLQRAKNTLSSTPSTDT